MGEDRATIEGGGAPAGQGRLPPGPIREELWGPAAISRPGALLIAVGLMLCVALGDYVTGLDVNFTLLYLGPIGLATWFSGVRAGAALSVGSALLASLQDLLLRAHALPAAVLVWNLAVQIGTFLALALLLGALRSRLASEQHAARTDPLTGVANRRAFQEMAAVELERARRTARPLTVAYLDVDDFKDVNDRQGHARGDQLLVTVGSTLRTATRSLDVVGRLGGDEFGLLLVDTDGPTAEALLSRLRGALDAALGGGGWRVTLSIGAATFLAPPASVDEMMVRADQLMYDAKRAGKNALRLDVLPHPPAAAARS